MQYPTKDLYDDKMDWIEFTTLLAGIMPDTPLGNIISIRAEDDADTLVRSSIVSGMSGEISKPRE